jgi:hypothetical protein
MTKSTGESSFQTEDGHMWGFTPFSDTSNLIFAEYKYPCPIILP